MVSAAVRTRAVAWRDQVVDAVRCSALLYGADPDLLLDSLRFIDTLDDLVNAKPTAEWFSAAIDKKVQSFMAEPTSYHYRTRPAADPWPILRKIDEYVSVAGRFKEVQPIRDMLAPVRSQIR